MGNKSWRILDVAWVQRHMSAEGKNKASLKRDVKQREILVLNDAKS